MPKRSADDKVKKSPRQSPRLQAQAAAAAAVPDFALDSIPEEPAALTKGEKAAKKAKKAEKAAKRAASEAEASAAPPKKRAKADIAGPEEHTLMPASRERQVRSPYE